MKRRRHNFPRYSRRNLRHDTKVQNTMNKAAARMSVGEVVLILATKSLHTVETIAECSPGLFELS
jgi:hypothetical protein